MFIPCGSNTPELVVDREPVERLRLGCSSGGNAADASCLTTAATKDHGEVAVAPKRESWSAGDLAREWFDQMHRSLLRGSLLATGFFPWLFLMRGPALFCAEADRHDRFRLG